MDVTFLTSSFRESQYPPPDLPEVALTVTPSVQPSPEVAQAAADSAAARQAYAKETEMGRSLSMILGVAAEMGKVLAPALTALLLRAGMVLLCLSIFAGMGCAEAVQVGSASQPAAVVEEGAVQAPVNLESLIEANVGPLKASVTGDKAMSQPAKIDAKAEAGRDVEQKPINVNVSGSDWAMVAIVALLVAGTLGVLYFRARLRANGAVANARHQGQVALRTVDRTNQDLRILRDNALAVAKAIAKLAPGSNRDALLTMISAYVPNRIAWDELLGDHGLRVNRTTPSATAEA